MIDHLLRLPLNYFDRRPVGELGTRVAELEDRNFLTSQALTTILDAAFPVIYIAVMLIYSWVLTLIALSVLPIQIGLQLWGPLFRRQFVLPLKKMQDPEPFGGGSNWHSDGTQNVEMVSRWRWQGLYSKYIDRTFAQTITGTALNQPVGCAENLSADGAVDRCFLSAQASDPRSICFPDHLGLCHPALLRLSSIWQNIQELRISFERLADVIDTPEESDEVDKSKVMLPPIHGDVRFENLSFGFVLDSRRC